MRFDKIRLVINNGSEVVDGPSKTGDETFDAFALAAWLYETFFQMERMFGGRPIGANCRSLLLEISGPSSMRRIPLPLGSYQAGPMVFVAMREIADATRNLEVTA